MSHSRSNEKQPSTTFRASRAVSPEVASTAVDAYGLGIARSLSTHACSVVSKFESWRTD